jgi:tRNA A-37 threonylcarbamoyl transferase component Bud32
MYNKKAIKKSEYRNHTVREKLDEELRRRRTISESRMITDRPKNLD